MTDERGGGTPGATAGSGNVYVFNVSNMDLNLIINGMPASGGPIPGWSQGYRPNAQALPRARYPGDGQAAFGNGDNGLFLQWAGSQASAQVNIDGDIPLNQDLLLFLARNQWQLVSQGGELIAGGTVNAGM